jgi:branched-chain amino acid transport system substrate-binding protein
VVKGERLGYSPAPCRVEEGGIVFTTTRYTGKLLSLVFAVVLVLAGLSACASSTNNNTTTQGPIKIGASISTSGDYANDGKVTKQAYDLWATEINKSGGLLGRQVHMDYVVDNSTPDQVTTNYTALISVHHDDLVVGPFADTLVVPAARVAHRFNYALVEGSGTGPQVFTQGLNNIFSVSLSGANYLNSFALYILSLPASERPTTAAYTGFDDPFIIPQITSAMNMLQGGGIKTVYNHLYPDETTDFTPYADKVINSGAQLAILGTFGVDDSSAFVKEFRKQHYNPQALLGVSGPDAGQQFSQAVGVKNTEGIFVPNGGWYPGSKSFGNDQFSKDFTATYGGAVSDITSDSVQAYSTVQVLQQAVEKAHSIDNTKLMQTLRSGATFNSIQGPVTFASDGQNTAAVAFLFQWQNGQLIPVYPQANAVANPEYPKKNWA